MYDPRAWCELYRCTDETEARAITTTIAAMEFDVRLHDLGSGDGGPFVIETRAEDWSGLADVLDQIVDEQARFDQSIARRDAKVMTAGRVFLMAMIAIVGLLALLGLVKL